MAQRGSLIQKLDEFIRAYYLNQLVNGALRSLAVLVCAGIGFALVESIGRFGIAGRTVLFWTLFGVEPEEGGETIVNVTVPDARPSNVLPSSFTRM